MTFYYVLDRRAEPKPSGPTVAASLLPVSSSQLYAIDSVALGETGAQHAITLTEFIDLECPFCAQFARTLDSAKTILGDTLNIRFVNFPLGMHRFAKPGAAAVLCAFEQGVGAQFVRTSYAEQDSLGFWTWARLARSAGVRDTSAFNDCRSRASTIAEVNSSIAVAELLEISGTPTILIDSLRYSKPPSLQILLRDVRDIARQQSGLE